MDTVKMTPPMPEPSHCPQCGTTLPDGMLVGLCPVCLLKAGAAADTVSQPPAPPFQPPTVAELAPLFPQLEIIELIGKGGMGAVYKARQKELDRVVALKILPPGIGDTAAFSSRFTREAKALARLSHPGIVTLFEFGQVQRPAAVPPAPEDAGLYFILMEYVDGVNLRQLLNGGRISTREALAIVPQICDALQYAHDQGIVHRDIKPENILLDRRGRVKVADFGLAKLVSGDDDSAGGQSGLGTSEFTESGKIMGTPQYMSPEQIKAPGEVDHRADIYALGVVFYQMLTGELPGKRIEAPSKKVQVDVRLDEVVLRALEKNPNRRYAQASQIKDDVETISGTPASPGPVPPVVATSGHPDSSEKIILPAFLLALFFGVFGAHRFYVGKIATGVLQLFTLGGFGIWTVIDWIIILCKEFTDVRGKKLRNWYHPANVADTSATATSEKIILPAFLLATFFGVFGAHRFYVGKIGTGILQLFTFGGLGIWAVIDWILILCQEFTDGQGKKLRHWLHPVPGGPPPPLTGGGNPPPIPGRTANAAGTAPSATFAPVAPVAPVAGATTPTMIQAPAIGLMIVAGLKLVSIPITLLMLATLPGWMAAVLGFGWPGMLPVFGVMTGVSLILFRLVPALLVLYGGYKMYRLRSHGWGIAAGILSILSCSLLGLGVGVWALVILGRRDVQSSFAAGLVPRPAARPPGAPAAVSSSGGWGVGKILIGVLAVFFVILALFAALVYFLFLSYQHHSRAMPALSRTMLSAPAMPSLPTMPSLPAMPSFPVMASSPGTVEREINLTFPLAPDGRFSIENVNGRIEITGTDNNEVVLKATVHGKDAALVNSYNFDVRSATNEVIIHPPHISEEYGGFIGWLRFHGDGSPSADYVIQVPRHARLDSVSNVNGRTSIDGVAGDIHASNVNGEIKASGVAGSLKLSNVNGRLLADFATLDDGQTVSLDNVSGRIETSLPANASVAVSANTVNGHITSEFPALAPKKDGPVGHKLKGTLNGGGAQFKVNTVNGAISIRRGK